MKETGNTDSASKDLLFMSQDARQGLVNEIAGAVVAALQNAGLSGIIARSSELASGSRDEWGSREDACGVLKCSLPTLHSLMKQGFVSYEKVGRKTLVNISDLRSKLQGGELSKYRRQG